MRLFSLHLQWKALLPLRHDDFVRAPSADGRLITFINFLSLHHKHFSPPLAVVWGDLFPHLRNLISTIDFFFFARSLSCASFVVCLVSSNSAPKNFRIEKRIFHHPRNSIQQIFHPFFSLDFFGKLSSDGSSLEDSYQREFNFPIIIFVICYSYRDFV